MVDASYMEGKASRPSAPKRFLDQSVIPAAADLAGCVEAGVERLAELVRRRPDAALGGAVLLGLVATRAVLSACARPRQPWR